MKNIASETTKSFLSILEKSQVQPNAVDLKIERLFSINSEDTFKISEDEKVHRGITEIFPDECGNFIIAPLTTYQFIAEGEVNVGSEESGFVITRSTLNRNGLFITSGLFDSGYCGSMTLTLHNNSGLAIIAKGTRVGQLLIWDSESLFDYDGDYGTGKKMEKMYNKK